MATTISALRQKFAFIHPEVTVDHLIIGGGVVGLAIGQQLVRKHRSKSTFIVERHGQAGQETSSRNSEVIHAGIYYPQDSLKTSLCLRGRRLLYDYCRQHSIGHRKIGKLIISTSPAESESLQRIHNKCQAINASPALRRAVGANEQEDLVPLRLLTGEEAIELEPNLSHSVGACLYSPETGIVDSHALITSLEHSINDSDNGEIVYGTSVVRIDKAPSGAGWVVQTKTNSHQDGDGERNSVLAHCVVNCAGLNAHNIYNHVLYPKSLMLQLGFCKGNYYSYSSTTGVDRVRHLLYPVPVPIAQPNQSTIAGLGTHLTLDMNRKIKFGPDVQWLPPQLRKIDRNLAADDGPLASKPKLCISEEEIQDFWQDSLETSDDRLDQIYGSVKRYLPSVQREHFAPDYSGIRPKLQTPNNPQQNETTRQILFPNLTQTNHGDQGHNNSSNLSLSDFYIGQSDQGFINLIGIESPGLTASLGIAEFVEGMICSRESLEGSLKLLATGGSNQRFNQRKSDDERVCRIGNLDDWAS